MASSRVYVGNLPMDIRTREVEDIFYKYGRIRDIDIKFPSRPPAFAFVDFDDPRDAEDAIDGRNGYDYDGNRLRVEAANASSKRSDPSKPKYPRNVRGTGEFAVDVSRLPSRMSWQDLKDYMRKAGDVVFTSVDGRGHGFVEYSNRSDMKYALDKLDDTAIRFKGDKVYIRVKPARSSSRSRSRSRSRSPRSSKKSRSRKRSYSRSRSRSVSESRSRSRSPRKSSSKKSRRDKDDEKRSTSRSPSKDRLRNGDDAVADQEEETKESLHDSNGKKSDDAPPSAATDHQTASKPDWTVLKVDDLREKLSARGLDTTGERDEMIERLEKSDGAAAESESQEQAAEAQQ